MSKLAVAAILLALLGAVAVRRQPGAARRPLREAGEVAVSKRLDPRKVDEYDTFALFPFDHTHPFLMGSSRPITERLTVAVWLPEARAHARRIAIEDAADHVGPIGWREQGALSVGEGTQDVNASTHDVWVVAREVEARGITVAYMVWKQDASLERARRTVDDVVASFRPGKPPAEYLAIARDRPAATRAARREALRRDLAARGVTLALDGPAVSGTDGTLYRMYSDGPGKRPMLLSLHYLGALPPKGSFEALEPRMPTGVYAWPTIVWFAREGGVWTHQTTRNPVEWPARIDAEVGARHADDAGRAHFYAMMLDVLDDPDEQPVQLDWLGRLGPRMKTYFGEGKMVR